MNTDTFASPGRLVRSQFVAPHAPGLVLLAVCHNAAWWTQLARGGLDASEVAVAALAQLSSAERLRLREHTEARHPAKTARARAWLDRVLAPRGGIGEAL